MTDNKIKPCPFCNSNNIEYSTKGIGNMKWKTAMYCKKCYCYGPRVIVTVEHGDSYENLNDFKYKSPAIDAWNNRS